MASIPTTERITPSELTERTALADLSQQRGLLIGVGAAVLALFLFARRRSANEQRKAARHLVRDWRDVDDVDDARDVLTSNVGPLLRPVLLMLLSETEEQLQRYFRRLEKSIEHL
jgi:hypothetical protein